MMPKSLLFLWFAAAVLLLGEGRDKLSPAGNNGSLPGPADATLKIDSEHDGTVEASAVSSKIGGAVTEKPLTTTTVVSPNTEVKPAQAKQPDESSTSQNRSSTHTSATITTVAARPDVPSSINAAAATVESSTSESSVTVTHAAVAEDTPPLPIRQTVVHVPRNSASFVSPKSGKWVVNTTNRVCLVVQMAVTLNVSYTDVNNKTSSRTFEIPADNTTEASGFCGESEQNLTLAWPIKTDSATGYANLTIHFVKNETEKNYSLRRVDVSLPAIGFPNSTLNGTSMVLMYNASSSNDYVVGLTESYRCLKRQTLWLKRIDPIVVDDRDNNDRKNETSGGYLMVSDLQFQAFKADNSTVFGLAKDCAYDTPDVVPIAVGCALAALVVIVLVAYLIGRRRNLSHGYLSM